MPNLEAHQLGSFCWAELGTSDQPGAKRFYNELFAWTANDVPIGPNDFYTMLQLRGRDVAAAYTLRPDQKERGVPPHWMLYVATDNADSTSEKAAQLGGKVLSSPFDVFDVGRMAGIQDPTGALFAIWQAKRHPGTSGTSQKRTFFLAGLPSHAPQKGPEIYLGPFG